MEWAEVFPGSAQPALTDMAAFIGGEAGDMWTELIAYMDEVYGAKPKLSYSGCSMKPGWNVKFQKSGQSFGTLYPEKGAFSAFVVISYKLEDQMTLASLSMSDKTRDLWLNAPDYMKLGRFMMLAIRTREDLADYMKICAVKRAPRI